MGEVRSSLRVVTDPFVCGVDGSGRHAEVDQCLAGGPAGGIEGRRIAAPLLAVLPVGR